MTTKTLARQMELRLDDVITHISPEKLLANPYQPPGRIEITEEEARRGWESLERSGLIHFPIVRKSPDKSADGYYEVGDGWQRRCWYLYGWKNEGMEKYSTLPCVVRELDDQQVADLAMEANQQRKDMTAIDLAWQFKKYLDEFDVTQEAFAAGRGISQEKVSNTIRLLELPEPVQQKIISKEITETHARQLLRLKGDVKALEKVAGDIVKGGWSVSQLTGNIDQKLWDSSKSLDPKAGSWENPPGFDVSGCRGCERAEKISQYQGGAKKLRCLDAGCWQDKQKEALAAETEKIKAELAKQGIEKLYESGELQYNEYNKLWVEFLEEYPECRKCANRAAIRVSYGVEIVCLDTECWEKKRKKEVEAERAERAKEAADEKARIERAVDGLADMTLGMRIVVEKMDDEYEYRDELPSMLNIEEPEGDEEFDVEAAVREKLNGIELPDLIKLAVRLAIEQAYGPDKVAIIERLEDSAGYASPVAGTDAELDSVKPAPDAILVDSTPNAQTIEEPEPIKDVPCNYCLDRDACDRSYFHADDDGNYVCERRRPEPFVNSGQAEALEMPLDAADPSEIWKKKLEEAVCGKSVRCSGCEEKHRMKFKYNKEDPSEAHWYGACPKCNTINNIKNARWDSMYGISVGSEEESEEDGT